MFRRTMISFLSTCGVQIYLPGSRETVLQLAKSNPLSPSAGKKNIHIPEELFSLIYTISLRQILLDMRRREK